mgnify:CR=1 FL=1
MGCSGPIMCGIVILISSQLLLATIYFASSRAEVSSPVTNSWIMHVLANLVRRKRNRNHEAINFLSKVWTSDVDKSYKIHDLVRSSQKIIAPWN